MICLICRQADVVDGITSVPFHRDEFSYLVRAVPARICPSCGETYVSEEVAVRLLQYAEALSGDGIVEDDVDYRDIV